MTYGCLLITNNVVAQQDGEFNAWYQGEHLDDRLGVAGFLSARRYQAIDSAQRYGAIYETTGSDVLLSPTYAALLAAPSPRTRAIMPHFRDVTRIIGRAAYRRVSGAGGVAAVLFVKSAAADDDGAQRIGALVEAYPMSGLPPEAVRVVVVEPDSVGVSTPESKMRPVQDRRADMVLIAEWIDGDGHQVAALSKQLTEAGWPIETDRGGLYRLICARARG